MTQKKQVLLICGPTASGKSALALALAARRGGVLVNADSMQIYKELRVITARPSEEEEAKAPHRLYGVAMVGEPWSAAKWRSAALAEIAGAEAPILVGGTGFYLEALIDGLSPVPDVPAGVREEMEALYEKLGGAAFHARLAGDDPVLAARLNPNDRQRLVRGAEVLAATGKPLSHWQDLPRVGPPEELEFRAVLLMPERAGLYARCDARFDAMLGQGALEEVRALLEAGYGPELPAMRAVGVAELALYLAGKMTLDQAVEAGKRETRRYAKRQLTWLRNRMARERPRYGFEIAEDAAAALRCF
jgi:tRNA dimethylallyltransferase